jgi:hypothetical protein
MFSILSFLARMISRNAKIRRINIITIISSHNTDMWIGLKPEMKSKEKIV